MIGTGWKRARRSAGVLLALVLAALLWTPPASAATSVASAPGACVPAPSRVLTVATIPKVVGFTFSIAGQQYTTDASGRVQIASLTCSDPVGALQVPPGAIHQGPGTTASFDSWHGELRLGFAGGSGTIYAAFRQRTLVHLRLVDLQGNPIPRSQVGRIVIKGSTGGLVRVPWDRSSVLLASSRVTGPTDALVSKDILWSVQRIGIDGNTAITRGKVRFPPRKERWVTVRLMLYPLQVTVRDAILGRAVGTVVSVVAPNGSVQTIRLGPGATGEVAALSRGRYILRAGGGSVAISFKQPVAMSRPQVAVLTVVSYADVAIGVGVVLALVLGLFLVGHLVKTRAQARRYWSGHGYARDGSLQPSSDGADTPAQGPTRPPPESRTEATRR